MYIDDCIEYLVKVTDAGFYKEIEFIDFQNHGHDTKDCIVISILDRRG